MTIYIIHSSEDRNIIETVKSAEMAAFWGEKGYSVTEQPDADEAEQEAVEALKDWLIDNYENGAHWVYETTDTIGFVVGLRRHGGDLDAYKADLRNHWEVVDDYASDIRAA